jgi:hypothetical protein
MVVEVCADTAVMIASVIAVTVMVFIASLCAEPVLTSL